MVSSYSQSAYPVQCMVAEKVPAEIARLNVVKVSYITGEKDG
jgi:hypothetical protein